MNNMHMCSNVSSNATRETLQTSKLHDDMAQLSLIYIYIYMCVCVCDLNKMQMSDLIPVT